MPIDGIQSVTSLLQPNDALERLTAQLSTRGITEFARIDHAAGAAAAGMHLRPTTLVIFGNPRGGTPLMQRAQGLGLELPLRVLVWQDESGQTRLNYTDPVWLAQRYGLPQNDPTAQALSQLLRQLTQAAAGDAP